MQALDSSIAGRPSDKLSLRRNFSWTALGNIIYAACQWGIVATLAKMGNAEMVGQFALGLAIATPISLFFRFALRGVQATDANGSYDFAEYLTLRLMTTLVAICLTLMLVLFWGGAQGAIAVVLLLTFDRAVGSISDIFFGAFQQRERMDIIARATMLNGIFSLLLVVAGIWLTGQLAVGVLGYLMGTAVPLIFYVIPKERARMRAANAPWISHDWKRLRSLLVLAFPLGIVMLLVSLTGNVPQYAIERSLGTQQLGVFAALSYLIVAGSTVVGALGQSAAPRLAVYFAARNFQAFWSLSRRLMAIGVALGIGGFVLARLIGGRMLSILYAPEYAAQTEVLEVLAIAAGFSFAASFAGYSMTAARKFAVQAPLFGGVLLVSVGASFGLVSEFGLMGAAFALMLTSAVQLALSLLVLKRATTALPEPVTAS